MAANAAATAAPAVCGSSALPAALKPAVSVSSNCAGVVAGAVSSRPVATAAAAWVPRAPAHAVQSAGMPWLGGAYVLSSAMHRISPLTEATAATVLVAATFSASPACRLLSAVLRAGAIFVSDSAIR